MCAEFWWGNHLVKAKAFQETKENDGSIKTDLRRMELIVSSGRLRYKSC